MPRPLPPDADPDQLRELYELEKRLADRLREAAAADRPRLYNVVYDEFFRALPDAAAPRPGDEQTRLQVELLRPFFDEDTVFLEVGSGDGALARTLAEQVGKIYAVDASQFIAESTGDMPSNLIPVLPEQLDSVVAPGSVDLAFSCHFLEHLHPDDLQDHLGQALSRLKPGAPYLMVTPNRLHGPHDISGYFSETPEGFHLREYSHGDLAAELRSAGFASVQALVGVGRRPAMRSVAVVSFLERLLEGLGTNLRRRLFDRHLAHQAPFRPLEQVMLIAWKSRKP